MATPLRRDLVARRNAPFAETWPFTYEDTGLPVDFTGATVTMQVRQYGAQPGTALINLGATGSLLTEGLLASSGQIAVYVDSGSLTFLPRAADGESVAFEYDLKVKLASAAVAEIWQAGSFTVKPGVTDRVVFLTSDSGALLTNASAAYLIGA